MTPHGTEKKKKKTICITMRHMPQNQSKGQRLATGFVLTEKKEGKKKRTENTVVTCGVE